VVTLALLTTVIWTDGDAEDLERATVTAACVSLGLALINLLSLARLRASHRWVRYSAWGLTVVLAAQIIYAVWNDDPGDNSLRILAATTVLLVAFSVLVPILGRWSGREAASELTSPRFCPACGRGLEDSSQPVTCPACGARFQVNFQ